MADMERLVARTRVKRFAEDILGHTFTATTVPLSQGAQALDLRRAKPQLAHDRLWGSAGA
jgi:hypothetical protein